MNLTDGCLNYSWNGLRTKNQFILIGTREFSWIYFIFNLTVNDFNRGCNFSLGCLWLVSWSVKIFFFFLGRLINILINAASRLHCYYSDTKTSGRNHILKSPRVKNDLFNQPLPSTSPLYLLFATEQGKVFKSY